MVKKKKTAKLPVCVKEGDKLNKAEYHLLEQLFLFCKKNNRSCQPESHRSFQISKSDKEANVSFCVLFKVDRQSENDPLIEEGPRPDYFVVYVSRGKCLATIIEMKSKKMEDGVDQVIAFHQTIKKEFVEHLPRAWKIHFQAIILGAPNSSIPERKIKSADGKGLPIFPLCYDKRFELFDYISEKMDKKQQKYRTYQHREFDRAKNQFTCLENIFKDCALPRPINDSYCAENRKTLKERKDGQGIYLDYLCDEKGGVLTFHATQHELIVVAPDSCKAAIEEEINSIGLKKVTFKLRD